MESLIICDVNILHQCTGVSKYDWYYSQLCAPCRSGTSQRLTIGAIVGISFGGLVVLALFVVAGVPSCILDASAVPSTNCTKAQLTSVPQQCRLVAQSS